MKCLATLLILQVSVSFLLACDTGAATDCVTAYLADVTNLGENASSGLCSILKTYLTCIQQTCPGALPQSVFDYVDNALAQYAGVTCDFSAFKSGAQRAGPSTLVLLLTTVAVTTVVFLRG